MTTKTLKDAAGNTFYVEGTGVSDIVSSIQVQSASQALKCLNVTSEDWEES